jgi:hypothetical protein
MSGLAVRDKFRGFLSTIENAPQVGLAARFGVPE